MCSNHTESSLDIVAEGISDTNAVRACRQRPRLDLYVTGTAAVHNLAIISALVFVLLRALLSRIGLSRAVGRIAKLADRASTENGASGRVAERPQSTPRIACRGDPPSRIPGLLFLVACCM
ncbi:hypothetical protein NUW54_g14280 [Trametes sanguinea]|uniref:Uncharacterized protein n=1 Tax=Trametes sanguinea TaxID=158606 RepID=A0ACC1MEA8_9APHY|nr:hypothetical protein NUW54_g14280 [Trametes sanguinea]